MIRLVFDIGGTHTRLALAENGALGDMGVYPTPETPEGLSEIARAFLDAHEAKPDEAAGGFAGMVKDGRVIGATNLPAWEGFDLATAVSRAAGAARVSVYNDADMAGYGEALVGAGKGYGVVAYVTVSTGVGGTLVIGGRIAPHATGFEPGQQIIDYEENRTLESYAGGAALLKEFGAPPERLPRAVLAGRTRPLAVGLYNVIRIWSPDALVLGGSVMNDETGYALSAVVDELKALPNVPLLPAIMHAALGDRSGLVGAAHIP